MRSASASLVSSVLAAAMALAEPVRAETLQACEQTIDYRLTSPEATVPDAMRAFSGVWVGRWDSGLCSALVVESVEADGSARLLYINGSLGGQFPIKAASRRFPGRITGNRLTAFGGGVAIDYSVRSRTELAGTYSASFGSFQGSFSQR